MLADPISSAVLHNSGTVIATCSGQRFNPEIGEDDSSSDEEASDSDESTDDDLLPRPPKQVSRVPDNSIKIWSL